MLLGVAIIQKRPSDPQSFNRRGIPADPQQVRHQIGCNETRTPQIQCNLIIALRRLCIFIPQRSRDFRQTPIRHQFFHIVSDHNRSSGYTVNAAETCFSSDNTLKANAHIPIPLLFQLP